MKGFFTFWLYTLSVLGFMLVGARTEAQLNLFATGSTNSIGVGSALTYTINVTNATGVPQVVIVTNTLPALTQFQGLVPPQPVTSPIVSTNGNTFTFILTVPDGFVAQMAVTATPTAGAAGGFITNSVVMVSTTPAFHASTNVITQVTNNVVVTQADLAVGMTVPT